jgi:nucleoside-diphosphate-sugar epimerase
MANWLVTGGAGFIGSHIVEKLLKMGEKVKVLDNFLTGRRENLEFKNPEINLENLEIIEGDIRDKNLLKDIVPGIDYISHQAALRSVPKSFKNPSEYNEVNVSATLSLLEIALKSNVKRVVYASSSSVYGEREDLPEKEKDKTEPISIYAATKLASEFYCKIYAKIYGLQTVVLRYFNVFGPRQSLETKYAVVVPKFIVSFLKGESPPIHGDGKQSRDFTYVENVSEANILASYAENASGEVFNIAGGKNYTILDLYQRIKEISKKEIEPTFTPPRIGDVHHTLADISKAKQILNYKPVIDFETGVEITYQWFKENLERYNKGSRELAS